MPDSLHAVLTRRERQIMDVLFRRGRATAAEVMEDLPGSPSYSTVRTQLRVLEEKGHVRHEEEGVRYIYMPAVRRHAARKSALKHLVDTFFDGSAEKAVAALLGGEAARVSGEELDRISELIAKAQDRRVRTEGKKGRVAMTLLLSVTIKIALLTLGGARDHCPAASTIGGGAALGADDRARRLSVHPGTGTVAAGVVDYPARTAWPTSSASSSLRFVSNRPRRRSLRPRVPMSCPALASRRMPTSSP